MKIVNQTVLPLLTLTIVCSANFALSSDDSDLSKSPAKTALEEMVVTSSLLEVPIREVGASLSVISESEIELRGYNSLTDLLRTQTSVSATNTGGPGKQTALRIRGEEGYRTLILIDGVEMSDPSGTQVGPRIEHLSSGSDISKIEILRGPQGFLYGADAGGVVSIFTKTSEETIEGQVNLEFGRFDTHSLDAHAVGSAAGARYFVSVNQQETNGFNARSDDPTEDKDGYENTTLHTKIGYQLSDEFSLDFVGRSIAGDAQFDACGFPRSDDCKGDFDQDIGKLSATFDNDFTTQKVAYAHTDVERSTTANGLPSFATEGEIDKLEYLGSYSFSDVFTFVSGADLKTETVESGSSKDDRDQLGVFGELQSAVGDKLFLSFGGRYDDNDDFGKHTSLRLSAAYLIPTAKGEWKLRGSAGNGFRAPSLSELAYNSGPFAFGDATTIQLKEEQSTGYDLGVEYYFDGGANLKLGFYKQDIESQILFDLVAFSGYLQANADTISEGVEFELEAPLNKHLDLFANYSYNRTDTLDDLPRIRRPERQANVGIEANFLDNSLSTLTNLRVVRGSQDEIFGLGRVALDDYEVVDLSVRYTLAEPASIFLRIENLFNENYEEVTGFNTASRAAYVGAQFSF